MTELSVGTAMCGKSEVANRDIALGRLRKWWHPVKFVEVLPAKLGLAEGLTVVVVIAWSKKSKVVGSDFTTLIFIVEDLNAALQRIECFDFLVRVLQVESTWT